MNIRVLTLHIQLNRSPQNISLHVQGLTGQLSMDIVPAQALQGDVAVGHDEASLRVSVANVRIPFSLSLGLQLNMLV